MNYSQSQKILEKVKKAKKVLLNCHRNPDPDSLGSALAMRKVLMSMGKEVEVICPSENLFENVNYLEGYGTIKKNVDFKTYDFSKYDLLITLDSASWDMVSGKKDENTPDIKKVVIDHHDTNTGYGDLNLIDKAANSVAEMLYAVFVDWDIKIDSLVADCLMAGIVGDTGAFRYPGLGKEVFLTVVKLIELGADKDKAITKIYRNDPFNLIKFYGEVLNKMEIDKDRGFVYSVISFETYSKLDKPAMAKESAASMFAQVVEGTEFGFIAVETEPKKLSVSFRSRTGFDTSKIAVRLGGGGHIYASGGRIEGLDFEKASEKLLDTVRRVVDEQKKS